jgi:hypothetical protein
MTEKIAFEAKRSLDKENGKEKYFLGNFCDFLMFYFLLFTFYFPSFRLMK